MAKPVTRPYTNYTKAAVTLLGQLIKKARIERRMAAHNLAERAGVSRGLVRRVESGDPGVGIGPAFELAALMGIQLFQSDLPALLTNGRHAAEVLTLLPTKVRRASTQVKDDF